MSAYNSPGGQKFIVYINFPFPGGELSFPALEITVSTAGHESFYVRILSFPRRDTTISPRSHPNYPIALHKGIQAFSLII